MSAAKTTQTWDSDRAAAESLLSSQEPDAAPVYRHYPMPGRQESWAERAARLEEADLVIRWSPSTVAWE